MENINIDGVNLGEVFENMKAGDPAYIVTLEVARNNSVEVESVERETVLETVNMDKLRKSILKIVVTAVASLVVINASLNIVNDINSPFTMENMSKEIGSVVRSVDDPGLQTIVSQNTSRNSDGTIVYNQEGIAKDLLSLDISLFDYALCSVCNDMGSNINNNVGVQGSNIDYVIYYLKMYSSMEGTYFNQYVKDMFNGVNSLNDYLIKNNYVDGGGNPSLDQFKTACNNNAEAIYDIIKSQVNKGASL